LLLLAVAVTATVVINTILFCRSNLSQKQYQSRWCYSVQVNSLLLPRYVGKVLRSACLYVCLSTRIPQKQHLQISPNFLYILLVAVARSFSDDSAIRCILPVLWVVMFSRNGVNGPESNTMYVSSNSPGGGTRGEVCRLLLLFRSTVLSRPNKVGLKCPSVHLCVHRSVRPQSLFDFNEIWHVYRSR